MAVIAVAEPRGYRLIRIDYWKEPRFVDLSWDEKYLMLCLLVNPDTKTSGRFRLHPKWLSYYTGFTEEEVRDLLDRLWDARLLTYDDATYEIDLTPCLDMIQNFDGTWGKLKRQVFERDNYTCTYCGGRHVDIVADHITPRSKGGSDALENLRTACRECNSSKSNRSLDEWGGRNV